MRSSRELIWVLQLALDGGLQVTGGFQHLKKGKDLYINYRKVIERSFLTPGPHQSLNMFKSLFMVFKFIAATI